MIKKNFLQPYMAPDTFVASNIAMNMLCVSVDQDTNDNEHFDLPTDEDFLWNLL